MLIYTCSGTFKYVIYDHEKLHQDSCFIQGIGD